MPAPRFRHSIRFKLLLLSLTLLSIPWVGYRFIVGTEQFIRDAQNQSLFTLAEALAAMLANREDVFPATFSSPQQTAPLPLLVARLPQMPSVDGYLDEWQSLWHQADHFTASNTPLQISLMLGETTQHIYLALRISDTTQVYGTSGDYLDLHLRSTDNQLHTYRFRPDAPGWVVARGRTRDAGGQHALLRGEWQDNGDGYTIELRLPVRLAEKGMTVTWHDSSTGDTVSNATLAGNPAPLVRQSDTLVSLLHEVTAPGMRIRVTDAYGAVLGGSNRLSDRTADRDMPWIVRQLMLWLLQQHSPASPALDDGRLRLQAPPVNSALSGGRDILRHAIDYDSQIIAAGAVPVRRHNRMLGTVLVEQSVDAMLSLQNLALQRLFAVTLLLFIVTVGLLLLFASWLTARIRQLRHEVNRAITADGRIVTTLDPPRSKDEIGDLGRSLGNALQRLGQYNAHLEAMASRLSHELATPLALVRTSLEHASLQANDGQQQVYLERALQGTNRSELILRRLREATRLEQALRDAENASFDLVELVGNQLQGYRQLYPAVAFEFTSEIPRLLLRGAPDLLCQALEKILDNAVGFRREQTAVKVGLQLAQQSVRLQIENDGPLLPDDIDPFAQMVSHRSQNDELPHLGLGLYLAKLIVAFHHGTTHADNKIDGSGVIITITIPVADVAD